MRRRANVSAAISAVALALAGCGGCGGPRRGPPPERFLPADVRVAVVVPETGRAAEELSDLHATVSGFPGAAELAGFRGALSAQLGFDPLDPDALADAGIDRRRGAALALLGVRGESPATLLVLPVSDTAKLEALLARLARERLGAQARGGETQGGRTIVTFRPAPGKPVALAYVVVERSALVAPGPGGPATIAAAAALGEEASLAKSAAFATARGAGGEDAAALVFAPPGSPLLAQAWPAKDGAALGVGAAKGRLRLRAALLLGQREASFRALAADGDAAEAALRLAPDAALVGRWDGDPAALGRKLLALLPEAERRRIAARGVDVEKDLLGALAPGAAVSLSLSPRLELGAIDAEEVRRDPVRAVEFEAVLPVKPGAEATIARVARLLAGPPPASHRSRRGGARESASEPTGRFATPSGEIAWRVDPELRRLVVAGGAPGRLEALEARLAGEGDAFRPATSTAKDALAGGLGGLVLDVQRLVASVRALPDEAFGTGPSGFVMRSVVGRFTDPASRLSVVSAKAELAPGALVVRVEVEAREGTRR